MILNTPVYASVVEEIKSVRLHVHRSIINGSFDDFSLWYARLKQAVIHRDGYAIFPPVNQIGGYISFEWKVAHFVTGYQSTVYPLKFKKSILSVDN